jgi:RNA polymerase sigma-70 factor (ECF subfamily)
MATPGQSTRAAWPQIDIPEPAFAAYLAQRGLDEAATHAADLYLACGCALGLPQALRAFESQVLAHLGEWVRRIDATPAFAHEVGSILREKLLVAAPGQNPKITEYSGRGALAAWARMVAMRTAIDLSRAPGRRKAASLDSVVTTPEVDPELEYLKQAYRPLFKAALGDGLRALSSEQRSLLKLHFVDGLSFEQMAAALGSSKSTVARKVTAAREQAFENVKELLQARLGVDTEELHSLIEAVRSRIDVSIETQLRHLEPSQGE